MIVVTTRVVAKPKARKKLLGILRGIIEPTRVLNGCRGYRAYRDLENKNAFLVIEEWESTEDFERYIRSEDYRIFLTAIDLLCDAPEIKIRTFDRPEGIEHIQGFFRGGLAEVQPL
jgi:quinol monooxygenase YgiN